MIRKWLAKRFIRMIEDTLGPLPSQRDIDLSIEEGARSMGLGILRFDDAAD